MSRGVRGAVGVPHLLANEVGQGLVESVLFHPLEQDIRSFFFFVSQCFHNSCVVFGMVPMNKKFGGRSVPAVFLESVDD